MTGTRDAMEMPENHFRRRAKNHEVRRSRRRRTLVAQLCVIGLRLSVLGALGMLGAHVWSRASSSPTYAVRKIQLVGAQGDCREELLRALDRFRGENLVNLSLLEVETAVRKHPWVWEASVRRTLPDGLEVRVLPRVPVALAQLSRDIVLVDREATVLGPPSRLRGETVDFPIITGIDGPADEEERLRRGLRALGKVLEAAPDMLADLSEVNVADPGSLRLVLRRPSRVLSVVDDEIPAELSKYFKVKDALEARAPRAPFVDLRFEDRVIVRVDDAT
ncbi:MAG: FtsQ-type POTRA domain-containing protein [Acidobacteriota bacterium]